VSPNEVTCDSCAAWVRITPEDIVVVRWCGSVLRPGWWVNGYCPTCGGLAVEHQTRRDLDAHKLIRAGADICLFSRPLEMDDRDWHVLVSPLPDDLAGDLARAVMDADDRSLGDELAALVEAYGS
jgi:hypothetical protein